MKKIRGRPRGSEKDDSKALNAMADLLHSDPALKPTTAIRRHIPKASDADIRRLQAKWKERGAALLAAAQARAEARQRRAASANVPVMRHSLGAVAEAARTAQQIYNSPEMRAMREFQNSPTARAIWEAQNSPAMQAMREAMNSPAMQAIRELQDSPVMRIARDIAEEQARINRALGGW